MMAMVRTNVSVALALTACVAVAARAQQPAAAAQPAQAQQQDTRQLIAILDFDIGMAMGQNHETPADYDALRRGLSALTISEVAANPAVRVVERAQIQPILHTHNPGPQ